MKGTLNGNYIADCPSCFILTQQDWSLNKMKNDNLEKPLQHLFHWCFNKQPHSFGYINGVITWEWIYSFCIM
jgi:hypothetical protein